MSAARTTAAALLAAPLLGCADEPVAPPPAAADAPAAASAASLDSSRTIRATFDCDDGRAIGMRFFADQGVAVLVDDDGRTHELRQQPAASGYRYASGAVAVRGKGDELRLEVAERAAVVCRERR